MRQLDQIYMKTSDMVLQSEYVANGIKKRLSFLGDGDAIGVCVSRRRRGAGAATAAARGARLPFRPDTHACARRAVNRTTAAAYWSAARRSNDASAIG
jgi:hypothetical protein